jgi:uncharacterized protein (TIGR02646 family)
MRRIRFDPDELNAEQRQWWDAWQALAKAAREAYAAALKAGGKPEFQQKIWSDLKAWMLKNALNGKCAYCESKFEASSFGEAEHYRPKSNVRDLQRKKVARAPGGPHQGYYWLAYEWTNLLPSCGKCNNIKRDLFPVAKAYVFGPDPDPEPQPGYWRERLNADEEPLLINPLFEDPSEYLVFGAGGTVVARDGNPRGQATIDVFGLDREELRTARVEQTEAVEEAIPLVLAKMYAEGVAPLVDFLERRTGLRAEYSAAVTAVVAPKLKSVVDGIQAAGGP